jgi:fimbrial chaperone protein
MFLNFLRAGLALAAAALMGAAWAGSLSVSPVRVEIQSPRTAAVVEIENSGTQPAQLQVERYQWTSSGGDGGMVPTQDFIVTPPILTLAPGQRQIVRVMFLKPTDPRTEASYRLIFQETPLGDPPPNTVATMLRLNLPVFVTPPGAKPQLAWSLASTGGQTRLRVRNSGNAHAFISSARGPDGAPLPAGGTVLPGETREWPLTSPLSRLTYVLRDGTEIAAEVVAEP